MLRKYNLRYQLNIIAVVLITVLFIFFLYVVLDQESNSYKSSIINEWTSWQKTTLNSFIKDAEARDDLEEYVLGDAIHKLKFNEASYVVFYRGNKVLFENNSVLTRVYSGKTIRATYGAYSYAGGYHLLEVLEAMEKGRSGTDYFVKNHAKGKEYITWIVFEHNSSRYILGSVTDEKYILSIYDYEGRKNTLYAFSYVYSFLLILLCTLLCYATYKYNTTVSEHAVITENNQNLITRLKENVSELDDKFEKLSICDYLTGTYNRKFFDIFYPKLEAEIFLPVSIALIDIDGLKLINSTFGYSEGDSVLIGIAQVLKEKCSDSDVFSRYGTDEFAIVMINTSYEEAVQKLITISKEVQNRFEHLSVEFSFGISTKVTEDDNIYDVMLEAENNLNSDKLSSAYSMHSGSINMLRKILHERTSETEEHCERIKVYAEKLASAIGMDEKKIRQLGLLAYLHDVGKIAMPDDILNKEGSLTEDEFEVMKTHPTVGYNIAIASPRLKLIAKHIMQHHERWDGKGYPKGLAGEEITIEARIISIVDAFDAMTSKRVYKEKYSVGESLEEIINCSGTHFDPELAKAFVKVVLDETSDGNTLLN